MIWEVPKIWEDGDVWILGGGPSVTKEFQIPDNVVQKVQDGTSPLSAYSPYLSRIHNEHVIGINVAYMIGNWIDMVFFGDVGFFLKHQEGLAKFPGLRVSCHPNTAKVNWVKTLLRDKNHPRGISSSPSMVSWNGNSGAAAISLAVHAGAARVILLGFDMKLDQQKNQHWHNVYGRNNRDISPKRLKSLPFERHLRGFAEIQKDAKRMGVEIINCCPDSAISEFKKFTLKQLLHDNT